jgi:hypothetical protein
MNDSTLFLTAHFFGVPDEEARNEERAAAALARIWTERGLSVDEIHRMACISEYHIERIFEKAGYKVKSVVKRVGVSADADRPKELAGVA